MEDLPDELLIFIFEYLNVQDLIRCSLVCKRFKSICKSAKIPELIITNKIGNANDRWFHTNKPFNYQYAIDMPTYICYRSILRLDKFKRLHFTGTQTEYEQLNVNDFSQLEQMKIYVQYTTGNVSRNENLDLPNLKFLEINQNWVCHASITTPKLEVLKCSCYDGILLAYPNTIKHLEGHRSRLSTTTFF